MSSRRSGPDYPWRLRIEHEGALSLRLDRRGRAVRFDPQVPPEASDIVVLTGTWPEHLEATRDAVRAGTRPTVVAPAPVIEWLGTQGELDGHSDTATLDGVQIAQRPYTPIPRTTPREAVFKAKSALRRPDRAARRLLQRAGLPTAAPVVTHLTFPDGSRLLHAALCLHEGTPAAWLDQLVADWGGPEWLVLGIDYGHAEAVLARVERLGARHVLFTDLLSEMRRRLGFPTELLTPARDRAVAAGMLADVFVSGAGLRYE